MAPEGSVPVVATTGPVVQTSPPLSAPIDSKYGLPSAASVVSSAAAATTSSVETKVETKDKTAEITKPTPKIVPSSKDKDESDLAKSVCILALQFEALRLSNTNLQHSYDQLYAAYRALYAEVHTAYVTLPVQHVVRSSRRDRYEEEDDEWDNRRFIATFVETRDGLLTKRK